MCTAVEARVEFLLHQSAALQKEGIVRTVLNMLEKIDKAFTDVQGANAVIINRMIDELDEAMMDLGLTPHQEELIRTIAVNCREGSDKAIKDGVALYDMFEDVRTKLDHVMGR